MGNVTVVHVLVVILSTAAWFVPLAAAMGGEIGLKRFQFPLALLLALIALVGALLVIGFEYAVGFLLLGGFFGAALTWAVLLDST